MMDELKKYCVFRGDIVEQISIGKICAQVGHAFEWLSVGEDTKKYASVLEQYHATTSTPKIVLKAKNLDALLRAKKECEDLGIQVVLIEDEGRTIFSEPTITCLGIGPVKREDLPKFVQKMRML